MQSNFPKIPLFLSIIFFILSYYLFFYSYKEINNNNQKSQLTEKEFQTEAARREEIKTLDRSIQIIEGERTQLETHFAQSSDVVPFLDTTEGLALKVGAKAEVVSVNILDDRTGLLVSMKASGSFASLYKFLTLLENSPYELEFVSMNMSKESGIDVGSKSATIPKWGATFKMKLLSFIK